MTANNVLEERMKNLEENNKKEHLEIKKVLDQILGRFDLMDEKYALRRDLDMLRNILFAGIGIIVAFVITKWLTSL